MKKDIFRIKQHECIDYTGETETGTLIIQLVDEHDLKRMGNELEAITRNQTMPFQLVAFKVNNWQTELTPWEAPAVFGKVGFGNHAMDTLRLIVDELLPKIAYKHVILGGYSLAGLFALWASYNTDVFDGIVAASPSVWYPGWTDYTETHTPKTSTIYLSLGNKEERTKNPVMALVGDCIRLQHEVLSQQGINTVLEWNEGNHFKDSDLRMAKGFAWVMNNVELIH